MTDENNWKYDLKDLDNIEYGSSTPFGFAIMTPHLYDSKGEEIEGPKCKTCDSFMNPLIGIKAILWICSSCGVNND